MYKIVKIWLGDKNDIYEKKISKIYKSIYQLNKALKDKIIFKIQNGIRIPYNWGEPKGKKLW